MATAKKKAAPEKGKWVPPWMTKAKDSKAIAKPAAKKTKK
jgi:hypothetical protein